MKTIIVIDKTDGKRRIAEIIQGGNMSSSSMFYDMLTRHGFERIYANESLMILEGMFSYYTNKEKQMMQEEISVGNRFESHELLKGEGENEI